MIDQWYFPSLMMGLNLLASVIILVTMLVMLHDLRDVTTKIGKRIARSGYRVGLSAFLCLVVMSEGMVIFSAVFSWPNPTGVPDTMSRLAWAGVSLWALFARPFTKAEVLCVKRESCPLMQAAGYSSGAPRKACHGSRPETLQPMLALRSTNCGGGQ